MRIINKRFTIKILLYILFAIFFIYLISIVNHSNTLYIVSNKIITANKSILIPPSATPLPNVVINNHIIPVDIATTTADVEKGLSGRTSLDSKSGLLFIFDKPDIYQFWMPDMHFPIDIIWINNNEIVDITKNATNIFDPQNPIFYKPSKPAQYVLEVNANFSEHSRISTGDKILFNNIDVK